MLRGRPAMQAPGSCWVTPKAGPELGSVWCSAPQWAQLFLCDLFPSYMTFTLWAHLGKTYSLHIQGKFISKIKGKGVTRRYTSFEALVYSAGFY